MRVALPLLFFAALAAAQGADTPAKAADQVLAVADDGALAKLAARDDPDPWLVADELVARRKADVALRFARAHVRPDTDALAKYIESRKDQPVQTELRAAIRRARNQLRDKKNVPAAAALKDKSGAGVPGVMAHFLRGHALRGLRRLPPSAKEFEAGAKAARELGWLEGQADGWHQAAVSGYFGADYRTAKRCWEERLPVAEKLGQAESAARTRANIGECYNRLGDYRTALGWFQGAMEAAEASKADDFAAQLHGNIGVIHKRLGNYKLAEKHQLRSLELCEKAELRDGVYRALANLGSLYHAQGDVGKARDFHGRGLAEAKRLGNKFFLANSLQNLAGLAIGEGNNQKAVQYQTQALQIQEELGRKHAVAGLHRALGISYTNLGEYDLSEQHFEKSLALLEPMGDRGGLANTLTSYGAMQTARGDYERARNLLSRARGHWEASGDKEGLAGVLTSLGTAHSNLGEYAEALRYYEQSYAIDIEIGREDGAAICLMNMGIVHRQLGDYERAQTKIEKGLTECRRLQQHLRAAEALQALGQVHIATGNNDAALAAYREAVPIFERDNSLPRLAATWLGIGTALGQKGEWKKAHTAHLRALKIAEDLKHDARIVAVLSALADAQYALGDGDAALASRRRATKLAHDRGYLKLEAQSLEKLARLLFVRGEYAESLETAKDAVGLTMTLTAGLADEQAAVARGTWFDLYKTGVHAAVELGDSRATVFFVEQSRAGALMETLGGREKLAAVTVPADLQKADRSARRAELVASTRYRSALGRGKLKEIRACRAALEVARTKVSDVVARIQREAKRAAGVIYPEPTPLADIRAALRKNETLVEFMALDDGVLVAVVLTPQGERVVKLKDAAATLGLCGALRLEDVSAGTSALEELRKRLVDPLQLAPKMRLLVSPHAEIANVPFGALVPDREIAYLPSGTTLAWLRSQKTERGQQVLAVGDPDYGKRVDPHAVTLKRSGGRLIALPATRIEVRAIGDRMLLGKQASETEFFKALGSQARWRAVHLACHGLVNASQPMHSSLALTADDESDGFLRAMDIFGQRIVADLVVLSACDTARGRVYKAEGVVGLTRAFMFAGAPRVIASLWKVDDEATRALMIRFYEKWNPKGGGGLTAAAALRAAQEHVRKQPRWSHPSYWAAWQLWGLPD